MRQYLSPNPFHLLDTVMTCTLKKLREVLTAGLILVPTAILAANDTPVKGTAVVELNTAIQSQDACRLTFTVQTPSGLAALETQTVLFDATGSVHTFTLFDFGEVPAGGLRVRQFDVPQTQCDTIGLILFNELENCTQADTETCITPPTFSSRVETVEVQQ
jgi:hypothetical protein